METPARPKHVIVVDADNPMVEVNGEFFWREDHDALLAAARRAAYETGYQEGYRAGSSASTGVRRHVIELRKRRSLIGWMVHAGSTVVALWCLLMFLAFLTNHH